MVVKLHNLPLSAGHECTGCLEAIAQGAVLLKAKVVEKKEGWEEKETEKGK